MKYPEVIDEITKETGREYVFEGEEKGLPSVTTILSFSDLETKEIINEWKNNVGEKEAEFITKRSSNYGNALHDIIHFALTGKEDTLRKTFSYNLGKKLAGRIIETYLLPNLSKLYGSEVPVYYPDLYAGRVDCVGVYRGKESIIDFKNSYKHKDEDQMENYKTQCAAYALAHDALLGTNITQGVILIATSSTLDVREIIIEGEEFNEYKNRWLAMVEYYYNHRS